MADKNQLLFHGHKCRGIIYLLCFFLHEMMNCVKHLLQSLLKYYSENNKLLDVVNCLKSSKNKTECFEVPIHTTIFNILLFNILF